ncbi:probable S-adenosylmethionine-dependent methyltransferase At5g38100 isoform X1 [Solanum pennellii]|uniref:Probable S-adenosylmethionine-dependent methyltransferase At5g38100 isoform X1 n=2 Tax=Solanum pennellii TaxID=28526 RepID=A0ABM1UXW8_SOLPN|nr:probable S-adenosylmethionine-dependent methyltransferase At5g38100 isoform X1 [Solanum pennellii]
MTSFPMNAGDGVYSYSKNSQLHKEMIDGAKEMVIDAIIQKLDIKTILSSSNTFHITELGCSVGPNTFSAMQYIVEALTDKYLLYQDQVINFTNNIPEFQIFFNDHVTNDFNILFRSLPFDRSYYAYGVPGSFYGRLFPSRSIHFAHSSSGINWLSKIPKELVDEKSPAWNKGLIHYVGASNVEVVNAYFAQFEKDMEIFFNVRAEEIVQGGMIVLITAFSGYIRLLKFFGSSLMDLANEGKLDESLVDSFNLPLYYPSPQDMTKVVRKNGLFSIERMELINIKSNLVDEADAKTLMMSLRSSIEGIIINHFGSKIGEEACARTILKSEEISEWMKVNYEKPSILFVALKRK